MVVIVADWSPNPWSLQSRIHCSSSCCWIKCKIEPWKPHTAICTTAIQKYRREYSMTFDLAGHFSSGNLPRNTIQEVFGSNGSVGDFGHFVRYSRKSVTLGFFNGKFQIGNFQNVRYSRKSVISESGTSENLCIFTAFEDNLQNDLGQWFQGHQSYPLNSFSFPFPCFYSRFRFQFFH